MTDQHGLVVWKHSTDDPWEGKRAHAQHCDPALGGDLLEPACVEEGHVRGIASEASFLRADENDASIGPEIGQISLDERGALGRAIQCLLLDRA